MDLLKPFKYFEPTTIVEAVSLLSANSGAKVLANGLDLLPRMRRNGISPECLVSLQKIPDMDSIKSDEKGLRIGALTTIRAIEKSPIVKSGYKVLYEAGYSLASIQVKTMSSIAGNICVGTPASDIAPALLVLEALLKIVGPSGERVLPVKKFFLGVNKTDLRPNEIVCEILLPHPTANWVGAFSKMVRTKADIAKVNVAIMLKAANNVCQEARIALGSVAPTVVRAKRAESALLGKSLNIETIKLIAYMAADEVHPITDIRSIAEYRQEMVKVMVMRTFEKALLTLKS